MRRATWRRVMPGPGAGPAAGVGAAPSGVRAGAGGRRTRSSRHAWMIIALVVSALLAACSGDGDGDGASTTSSSAGSASGAVTSTTEPGISEDEAVEAARRSLAESDPDFDFSVTRVHVAASDDTYDISFVPVDLTGPGGEPHVVIDRATGAVVETYLTR